MSRKELMRSLKFFLFSISAGIIELIAFPIPHELPGWTYWPCSTLALVL